MITNRKAPPQETTGLQSNQIHASGYKDNSPLTLQIQHLSSRLRLPITTAQVIAPIAFGEVSNG